MYRILVALAFIAILAMDGVAATGVTVEQCKKLCLGVKLCEDKCEQLKNGANAATASFYIISATVAAITFARMF